MMNLRDILIKFYGGYTEEEMSAARNKCFNAGIAAGIEVATQAIKIKMESLYGTPADEWCKKMYSIVSKGIEVEFNKKEDDEKDEEQ